MLRLGIELGGVNPPNPIPKHFEGQENLRMASGGWHENSIAVGLTLTLTLTLTRVFWPQRDKAQALTLILPGGAAAEPQAGWARHSVTVSDGSASAR